MKAMKISVIYSVYDTHPTYGEKMYHKTARVLGRIKLDQGRKHFCGV